MPRLPPRKPRNPFAIRARQRRAGPHKDRRAPRGGAENASRDFLDETLDLGYKEGMTTTTLPKGTPAHFGRPDGSLGPEEKLDEDLEAFDVAVGDDFVVYSTTDGDLVYIPTTRKDKP